MFFKVKKIEHENCCCVCSSFFPPLTCVCSHSSHSSKPWLALILNMHHGRCLIRHLVSFSSVTQRLGLPEVYQVCSMQIRSGRAGGRRGVCQEVCVAMYKTFAFFLSTQPRSQTLHLEHLPCDLTGDLRPHLYTLPTLHNMPFCT